MKLLSNKELKKLSPQNRQSLIVDGLKELIESKYLDKSDYSKISEQLLKLYLLDRGESIDVDFSSYNHTELEKFLNSLPTEDIDESDNIKKLMDKFHMTKEEAYSKLHAFWGDRNFSERIKRSFGG